MQIDDLLHDDTGGTAPKVPMVEDTTVDLPDFNLEAVDLINLEQDITAMEYLAEEGLPRFRRVFDRSAIPSRQKIALLSLMDDFIKLADRQIDILRQAKAKQEKSESARIAAENEKLQAIADMITSDETAFHGAVNAGIVMPDFRTVDISSLGAFIKEGQQAGVLGANADLINIAGQVVAEIKKWR